MTINASEETLFERKLTFRNSTFGGLKTFIREHEHKTGERLTNAAAVDTLLRAQLARCINRFAAHEMMTLARPTGALALQQKVDPPEAAEGGAPSRPLVGLAPAAPRLSGGIIKINMAPRGAAGAT